LNVLEQQQQQKKKQSYLSCVCWGSGLWRAVFVQFFFAGVCIFPFGVRAQLWRKARACFCSTFSILSKKNVAGVLGGKRSFFLVADNAAYCVQPPSFFLYRIFPGNFTYVHKSIVSSGQKKLQ